MNRDRIRIQHWTVDFCDGSSPEEITIPHVWRQDVPLSYEGPVIYRTCLDVPQWPSRLVFSGVSYAAEIRICDVLVCRHQGLWDAFEVPLRDYSGKSIDISVSVVKNGGTTYPVNEVASGFLPFVFHTFGGIHGEVSIVSESESIIQAALSRNRASVRGSQIFVDGKPFYVRGLLHWGWYPEIGHTNPPEQTILNEVRAAKQLGFNLVKFCLWVPSHRYLQILREEGMEAWIELPLWDPTPDVERQTQIAEEFERIVRQYRHHENVILWTVGCELSASTSAYFRQTLTQLVKNITGSPLVKDNSGGAEMYGGNLAEFGDFYDFHPYCDTQFFPQTLDTLLPGPRRVQPLLLGEFNDIDVHRDLPRLSVELPFWCSTLAELNDQGVRWQYDLPAVLGSSRFTDPNDALGHQRLAESSRQKAVFMRKTVHEAVRSREQISGYVITGWRDTPISSAGFFDDWDQPRFTAEECQSWNSPSCIFIIPSRRPPWVHGGNRPGFIDPYNQFVGQVFWGIGLHSEVDTKGGIFWRILDAGSHVVAQGAQEFVEVPALCSKLVGQIDWTCNSEGTYRLEVEFADVSNAWTIHVVEPFSDRDRTTWRIDDPFQVIGFSSNEGDLLLSTRFSDVMRPGIMMLTGEGTLTKPFWREAAYEFLESDFWSQVPFVDRWERFIPISPDRVLSRPWLESLPCPYEILMNRVDVRTYDEDPIVVRIENTIITTLRPFGGLSVQPSGIPKNASGLEFVRGTARALSRSE